MKAGDAAIELAERRVELERAASIARVRAAARSQYSAEEISGPRFCDCGEPIPEARRLAMPGCRRCIDCETFIERQSRRRA
ncbi:MAG: hypothetical protein E5V97_22140 [Mesorhizobium sp.]|nr:MAG: hypothetical protein E5V97_22140 [Mesorhizobium sp.]